jgi:hypothetical protein
MSLRAEIPYSSLANVELPLHLIKYHTMKTYGGVEF